MPQDSKVHNDGAPCARSAERQLEELRKEWRGFRERDLERGTVGGAAREMLEALDRFLLRSLALSGLSGLKLEIGRGASELLDEITTFAAARVPELLLTTDRSVAVKRNSHYAELSEELQAAAAVCEGSNRGSRAVDDVGCLMRTACVTVRGETLLLQEAYARLRMRSDPVSQRSDLLLAVNDWSREHIELLTEAYSQSLLTCREMEARFRSGRRYAFSSTLRMPPGFDEYEISEALLPPTQGYLAHFSRVRNLTCVADALTRPGAEGLDLSLSDALRLIKRGVGWLHPRFPEIITDLDHRGRMEIAPAGKLIGFGSAVNIPGHGSFLRAEFDGTGWTYWLLAHEIGHAVHGELLPSDRYFLRLTSPLVSETVAQVFANDE